MTSATSSATPESTSEVSATPVNTSASQVSGTVHHVVITHDLQLSIQAEPIQAGVTPDPNDVGQNLLNALLDEGVDIASLSMLHKYLGTHLTQMEEQALRLQAMVEKSKVASDYVFPANLKAFLADHPEIIINPSLFSCPIGWVPTFLELLNDVAPLVKAKNQRFVVLGLKEKFAGARISYDVLDANGLSVTHDDDVKAAVSSAILKFSVSCMRCGAPGSTITTSGWMHVACPEHAKR